MREIIAVCRSKKKSRDQVARVLDRYFWRIGDRTWRGKATNACLDRVARELRQRATRITAVVIHEIRSSHESRMPLIRIGSRSAFSDEGVVPVASHPADFRRHATVSDADRTGAAVVGIAALFHDLGKATNLFQKKLCRALEGGALEADAVRHELFSAAVWDHLFGILEDKNLPSALKDLTSEQIDKACLDVGKTLQEIHTSPEGRIPFSFVGGEGSLSHLIGMLILTHHRLPAGDTDHVTLLGGRHVRSESSLDRRVDLAIAPGIPFWHENWWLAALRKDADGLCPDVGCGSADIALRASLMFADHLGSALKKEHAFAVDHLGNTIRQKDGRPPLPADSLSWHVKRVYRYSRFSHEMFHGLRDRFPALDEDSLPIEMIYPGPSPDLRFAWQGTAARAARSLCESREGGFFSCILAGTGTGKSRGAPTLLANAAMGDTRPERRYLRMSLGLGLRVLATQSAREYVTDLGLRDEDVSVLVGDPPLQFPDGMESDGASEGSESLLHLPPWLRVERAGGVIPKEGSNGEDNWLRGLSLDTDRGLPAFLDLVLEHAGRNAANGRRLLQAPIMVGTIDHLMGVAAPVNSRFLMQSLRVMTSDLILDEIDQYEAEDLAAIGRLIYQSAAAGRRVVIMSATLASDIAEALYHAYRQGWEDYARSSGISPHVNLVLCGNTPDSVFTNRNDEDMSDLLCNCRDAILKGILTATPIRRGEILPPCNEWHDLVSQIDQSCSRLHDHNAVEIDGLRVSVGLVRMTRVSHTAALAVQMRSGYLKDRLRLLVCLHSQLPRLHRAYLETRLKCALTRKGADPEAGVRSLCHAKKVFKRAREVGTRNIEIIVISSPVIETGNDLDFDYAILDPISTRSVIQTAGRVRRHRPATGVNPNVLILGRSPIAMQGGRLARPGVETRPARETGVPGQILEDFEGRNFSELAGNENFSSISAACLLSDEIKFPLRDAELELRRHMISTEKNAPLGLYLARPNSRWNLQMTKTRRFRRSETSEVLYCMMGETLYGAEWFLDLEPGGRNSKLRQASGEKLHLPELFPQPYRLFENLTSTAWGELSSGNGEMEASNIRTLLQTKIPGYKEDLEPEMTYAEFTGFTRGKPEVLFESFGKIP